MQHVYTPWQGLRPLKEELRGLRQPALILRGTSRGKPNDEAGASYSMGMRDCTVTQVPNARNVLPWELPEATCAVISAFCEAKVPRDVDGWSAGSVGQL